MQYINPAAARNRNQCDWVSLPDESGCVENRQVINQQVFFTPGNMLHKAVYSLSQPRIAFVCYIDSLAQVLTMTLYVSS